MINAYIVAYTGTEMIIFIEILDVTMNENLGGASIWGCACIQHFTLITCRGHMHGCIVKFGFCMII